MLKKNVQSKSARSGALLGRNFLFFFLTSLWPYEGSRRPNSRNRAAVTPIGQQNPTRTPKTAHAPRCMRGSEGRLAAAYELAPEVASTAARWIKKQSFTARGMRGHNFTAWALHGELTSPRHHEDPCCRSGLTFFHNQIRVRLWA
jgi:hypothetical protein